MSGTINEVSGYFRINLNVKVGESENYLGFVFKKKDTRKRFIKLWFASE